MYYWRKKRILTANRKAKRMICFLWSLAGAFLFPKLVSDDTLRFSNSVFSLLLFGVIFILLDYESRKDKSIRCLVCSHCLGFIFTSMTAFGYSLDAYDSINIRGLILCVFVYTHVFAELISFIWDLLARAEEKLNNSTGIRFRKLSCAVTWLASHPAVIVILLLLMWLPVFIADYPGGFRYDAANELNQAINGYTGDFPLLHSAIITKLIPLVYSITGSYNAGIALYIVFQMIMIAVMYAHMICCFVKQKVNEILILLVIFYCGFFPVIQILVVQEVRDILFSALLMYSAFWLYLLESDKKRFFQKIRNPILLSVIIVFTILSRNNNTGIMSFLAIGIVSILFWVINRKENRIGATTFSVVSVVLYFLASALLIHICQPFYPANTKASLSLASQSLARAYLQDEWTKEETEELSQWMNVQDLNYVAENADSTKGRLIIPAGEETRFLLFWEKTGLRHLGSYFDAILANTQNMWFPPSVIDGYKQLYKKEGEPYWQWEKCYYSISDRVEKPAEHMHYWPSLLNFYTQIGLKVSFEKIPVISMMFSIGFQFWMLLNCLFYNIFRKNKRVLLPLLVILLYMIVSACVPLIILRYFAAIFFCVPMIMVFTLQPLGNHNSVR